MQSSVAVALRGLAILRFRSQEEGQDLLDTGC